MRHSTSKASKKSTARTSKASKASQQSIPLARCAAALTEAEESKITQHLVAVALPNPRARPRTAPLSLACITSFTMLSLLALLVQKYRYCTPLTCLHASGAL
jgi:hypothetical protein